MYNQFCKNLKNFMEIMGNDESSRKRTAYVLLQLTDVRSYFEYKKNGTKEYNRISNLIYDISQYSKRYPSLEKLIWELWAYGFDIEESKKNEPRNYEIEELVKLADLMLSTHYFA